MAGIDKTYVNNWKDYKSIRDWAVSVGTVIDNYGNKITPINWFYHPDLTEDEFNKYQKEAWDRAKERYAKEDGRKYYSYYIEHYGEDFINDPTNFYEVVIWNTWTAFDIWLIRNCPLTVIKSRLIEQYGAEFIELVKHHKSEYDLFNRNGVKDPHFRIQWLSKSNFKDDRMWWWIEPVNAGYDDEFPSIDYYDAAGMWYFDLEAKLPDEGSISSVCDYLHGQMSPRRIYRLLRKWNLPKGFKLKFTGTFGHHRGKGHYVMQEFIVTVK